MMLPFLLYIVIFLLKKEMKKYVSFIFLTYLSFPELFFPFCRFRLLSVVTFFQLEKLSLAFHIAYVFWHQILSVLVHLKLSLFCLHFLLQFLLKYYWFTVKLSFSLKNIFSLGKGFGVAFIFFLQCIENLLVSPDCLCF